MAAEPFNPARFIADTSTELERRLLLALDGAGGAMSVRELRAINAHDEAALDFLMRVDAVRFVQVTDDGDAISIGITPFGRTALAEIERMDE